MAGHCCWEKLNAALEIISIVVSVGILHRYTAFFVHGVFTGFIVMLRGSSVVYAGYSGTINNINLCLIVKVAVVPVRG